MYTVGWRRHFLTKMSFLTDIFAKTMNYGFSQIAGVKESYVLADDIESPSGRRIPLWMLGFIY